LKARCITPLADLVDASLQLIIATVNNDAWGFSGKLREIRQSLGKQKTTTAADRIATIRLINQMLGSETF